VMAGFWFCRLVAPAAGVGRGDSAAAEADHREALMTVIIVAVAFVAGAAAS
jgi:hypothetical protein